MSGPTVDSTVEVARALAQVLGYAGVAMLIGAGAFRYGVWPTAADSPRFRWYTIVAVSIAAAGTVGTLLLQGPYVAGRGIGSVADVGLQSAIVTSGYGWPLLLRMIAVGLAVPVLQLWPRPSDEDDAPGPPAAVGVAVLLGLSFGLAGHAAVATPRLLAEAADGVHLVAAGIWVGGLSVLLFVVLPETPPAALGQLLPRWSWTAKRTVAVLAVTGGYQGWREVGSWTALTTTAYGQLLTAKLLLVATMVAMAGVARWLVGRRAYGGGSGPAASAVAVEALIGVGILTVTTVLVGTAPALR